MAKLKETLGMAEPQFTQHQLRQLKHYLEILERDIDSAINTLTRARKQRVVWATNEELIQHRRAWLVEISELHTHIEQLLLTDEVQPKQVSVIIAIKAGVMEMCQVFRDQADGDQFYEKMRQEYNIDPLSPDSCAEDVLHLRKEIK